jgi:hypothetical protein
MTIDERDRRAGEGRGEGSVEAWDSGKPNLLVGSLHSNCLGERDEA